MLELTPLEGGNLSIHKPAPQPARQPLQTQACPASFLMRKLQTAHRLPRLEEPILVCCHKGACVLYRS